MDINELVIVMQKDGYDVTIDHDGDPCFHVSRQDFARNSHNGYYQEVLARYGYRNAFQVIADREREEEI